MPLRLPDKLPAIDILKGENIFVIDETRGHSQDIRPLRIVILNLMPIKVTTETDLIRLLSNTPLQIDITFMKLKSHTSKNTPIEHMMMFYRDFDELKDEKFDGMIITGAPVENMEFEEVNYWDEITKIFDWSRTHVTSTMYICWAAQAGLYHHYGIQKHLLPKKMFGIFRQHCVRKERYPIFRGFDDTFAMPHSRHTVSSTSRGTWSIILRRFITSICAIRTSATMWRCRRTTTRTITLRRVLWLRGVLMPISCSRTG